MFEEVIDRLVPDLEDKRMQLLSLIIERDDSVLPTNYSMPDEFLFDDLEGALREKTAIGRAFACWRAAIMRHEQEEAAKLESMLKLIRRYKDYSDAEEALKVLKYAWGLAGKTTLKTLECDIRVRRIAQAATYQRCLKENRMIGFENKNKDNAETGRSRWLENPSAAIAHMTAMFPEQQTEETTRKRRY